MKTMILLAVASFTLAGCAGSATQDGSQNAFEDTYTPTGSHIARKTVDRNNGVQMISKEELQRTLENARSDTPSR